MLSRQNMTRADLPFTTNEYKNGSTRFKMLRILQITLKISQATNCNIQFILARIGFELVSPFEKSLYFDDQSYQVFV